MLAMAVKAGVYGGRTHEERRRDRRERLLDAVLTVWGGADAGPVTMTRVCAEAGLSERYFYEQFANLDAALLAVLEQVAQEIAVTSVAALEQTDGDPRSRARAGIAAFVQILTDDPRKGRVALIQSMTLPSLRARRAELLRDFVTLTVEKAEALHGESAWTGPEGRLAATLFIGGIAQLVTDWIEDALPATPDELVDAATYLYEATAHR